MIQCMTTLKKRGEKNVVYIVVFPFASNDVEQGFYPQHRLKRIRFNFSIMKDVS